MDKKAAAKKTDKTVSGKGKGGKDEPLAADVPTATFNISISAHFSPITAETAVLYDHRFNFQFLRQDNVDTTTSTSVAHEEESGWKGNTWEKEFTVPKDKDLALLLESTPLTFNVEGKCCSIIPGSLPDYVPPQSGGKGGGAKGKPAAAPPPAATAGGKDSKSKAATTLVEDPSASAAAGEKLPPPKYGLPPEFVAAPYLPFHSLALDLSPLLLDNSPVQFRYSSSDPTAPKPPQGLNELVISISVVGSDPLLSDDLTKELLPVEISLKSIKKAPPAPAIPMTPTAQLSEAERFALLDQAHQPVSATFSLFNRSHRTVSLSHQANLPFGRRTVYFLGTGSPMNLSSSQLAAKVAAQPCQIELRDRDPKKQQDGVPSIPVPPLSALVPAKESKGATKTAPAAAPATTAAAKGVETKSTTAGAAKPSEDGSADATTGLTEEQKKTRKFAKKKGQDDQTLMYGAAEVWLGDLFKGSTHFSLTAPVFAVYPYLSDPNDMTIASRVDLYAQSGTYVRIGVRLARRLQLSPPEETPQPFSRAVFVLKYRDTAALSDIVHCVAQANLRALGMAGQPARSLGNIRLTDAQRTSTELDILTGIQLIDKDLRLIVVEGLAEHSTKAQALKELKYTLPRGVIPPTRLQIMYSEGITYAERMYGGYDAELKNIRLGVPLNSILTDLKLFMGRAHRDCFFGAKSAADLRACRSSSLARALHLFPTPIQLAALEKRYGTFVSDEDLEGVREESSSSTSTSISGASSSSPTASPTAAAAVAAAKKGRAALVTTTTTAAAAAGGKSSPAVRFQDATSPSASTSVPTTATSSSSPDPSAASASLSVSSACTTTPSTKKVGATAGAVRSGSATTAGAATATTAASHQRPSSSSSPFALSQPANCSIIADPSDLPSIQPPPQVFMYSGQRKNMWELQKAELRKKMETVKNLYVGYSEEYQSMAFGLDPEDFKRYEREENKRLWRTQDGFRIPGPKTSAEARRHKLATDEPKQTEEVEYTENPWRERPPPFKPPPDDKEDFVTRPVKSKDFGFPGNDEWNKSIHISFASQSAEAEERKRQLKEEWQKKVLVDSLHFRVDNRASTRGKLTQPLDALDSLLHDPPKKKALKFHRVAEDPKTKAVVVRDMPVEPPLKGSIFLTDRYRDPREAQFPRPVTTPHAIDPAHPFRPHVSPRRSAVYKRTLPRSQSSAAGAVPLVQTLAQRSSSSSTSLTKTLVMESKKK